MKEKENVKTLIAKQEHLKTQISTLIKCMPEVDIKSPYCPFCQALQPLVYDGDIKLYDVCACEQMRQYREQQNQLKELEEALVSVNKLVEDRKKYADAFFRQSSMGSRFFCCVFDNFDKEYMPKAYEIAYDFAKAFDANRGNGLIFTGDVGTGKTHLAAAISNYVVKNNYATVEFVSYPEVLANIRAAFSNSSNYQAKIEQRMSEAQLLIIDDLCKEKQSEFTNEFLYRVVNKRYMNNLPFVITTNCELQEMSARVDEAVFSRIMELCRAVDMRGKDYRLRKYWS